MVNSYRYVFAASTSTIPSSGTTVDLGIGEIGVFDGKSFEATNGVTAKSILIAQGTPDTVFPHGIAKSNHTYKTDVIKGSAVKSWKKVNGKKGAGMQVTLGYDGVDTTKNLTVKEGKSFSYWVTLSGAPIANLLGDSPKTHYATWTEQFTVQLPCVDECADNCGDTVDPNIVADAAIAEFNNRKIIGGQPWTDYVKVTKLVSCDTPSGLPTVEYTVYTLTIADAGDQAALGAVQAQYPGVRIKRTKREGLNSTYEGTVASGDTTFDTAFSYTPAPVLPACDTCGDSCPSGYTAQDAQDVWIVTRPITSGDALNTTVGQDAFAAVVLGDYGDATVADFLSFTAASASVKLYFPAGTTVTAEDSDFVVQLAVDQEICTWDGGATETSWVECKTCTAAQKSYTLTVANDCLNTPSGILTELEAIYGEGVTLESHNADTCTSKFAITVESDNKDCDSCGDILWTFSAPKPFKGLVWTEVQGNHYGTDCNVGLRFESVYEQRKTKECFLKQVAFEFEPLFIAVSVRNPDPNDYSVLCDTDVPVTVVKNVEYPRGLGRVVADQVIASNYQFNQPWRKNPAERDALEYELGIDLEGVYDQYVLEFQTFPAEATAVSGFGVSQVQTFELSVFYPVGTGGSFESVVSAFVAANSPLSIEVL